MKKIITILIIVFSITSTSYAQSSKMVQLLNELVQENVPSVSIAGGNGTLIANVEVALMDRPQGMSARTMASIIKDDPERFGSIFLDAILEKSQDSLYEIGVRNMKVYFITPDKKKIYGGHITIEHSTINYKSI